jgi:hypothetical protein
MRIATGTAAAESDPGGFPKYGARGYRFGLLKVGHMVQNILLTCTAILSIPEISSAFISARSSSGDRSNEELKSRGMCRRIERICAECAYGNQGTPRAMHGHPSDPRIPPRAAGGALPRG